MAKQVVVDLKANTSDVQKGMDKLADAIADLNEALGGFNKEADNLDDVADSAKKAESGFKKFGKTLSTIGKAGGIIFLLTKAFDFFKEVLGQNQTVVDATATAMEFLSLTFNDFFSFLQNNVGTVTETFTKFFDDPLESINNLRLSIQEGIIKRVKQGIEALGLFGKAAVKFFQGDWAGASETAKEATKELFDVVTGEEGGFEAVKETITGTANAITEYAKSTFDSAKANVELQKTAELGIAQNRIILEQKDREAEKLRQIRDDEARTIEERIEANNKLAEVLNEQERLMLANVDALVASAQAQFDKNASQENQIALLEAQAEKEGVLAQIEGFRSEQLINVNSLERERQDLIKEAADVEKQLADEALARDKMLQEQKVANIKGALSNIATIVGANSKFGKAIAIVQAIQDTFAGANKALAQGGIFGFVGAAAVIAAGIANVKNITSTKTPNPPASLGARSTGGQSTPAISTPATPSLPPQFSTVGASGTNQLAELLGNQPPPRAFVVSGDVSTAQELDRNIVTSASLG
tara:strand:+ start:4982 stop:6568 length:1587 start_codon:yes stop_codon:yes gene_type:complete